MKQEIKERIESAQEKALLCETIIQQFVRSGEYRVVSLDGSELKGEAQDFEVMEQCAILAEIAADYSTIVRQLLDAEDSADE